jgi:hypothetical protein
MFKPLSEANRMNVVPSRPRVPERVEDPADRAIDR